MEDIKREIEKTAHGMGYDRFLAVYVNPEIAGSEQWIYNYTLIDLGVDNAGDRDPVLAHVRNHASPVIWGPEYYKQQNAYDLWSAAHDNGLHWGIACPTRPGGNRRFTLYIDSDKPFDGNSEQLALQTAELALFTQEVAGFLVALGDNPKAISLTEFFDKRATALSSLSHYELEVLRWVFDNHTLYTIAKKIKKHESYVSICIDEAMRKLNAPSPLYAAIFAAQLGLFDAKRR